MANVDVTSLLGDPDFIDPVTLTTRTSSISSLGENLISEASVKTVGSVQPASGKAIQRLPEALRVANMQSFWIKGPIPGPDGNGRYTSIFVFKGVRFQIITVFPWTNWGEGWSEGLCVAEKPA